MTQRDIETAALLYANEKFPPKIGTIGGGGHYAEVDLNEENCKQCYRHFLDGYSLSLERIGELEKALADLAKEYNELDDQAKIWKEESGK